MTLTGRLGRLASVTRRARASELHFAVRAWLLAPVIEASLALVDVRTTLRWSSRLPRSRARGRVAVPIDAAAQWVDRAYAVHLVRGRCLPRALVQHALHVADGVACRLVIGVRRAGDQLDAHAWVDTGTGPASNEGFTPILIADASGVFETAV